MKQLLLLSFMALLPFMQSNAENTIRVSAPQTEQTTEVTFFSPTIVHVQKYPASLSQAPRHESFSVILMPDKKLGKQMAPQDDGQTVSLSSDKMTVSIDKKSGQLTFKRTNGLVLLREKTTSTTVRQGDADAGKLKIGQTWTLDGDEAVYGLGQLRDTAMTWRGRDMELWNHNTYISIPYITSEKGYGIYWDNAGRSRFTDNNDGMTFTSEVAESVDYYFMYDDGTQDGVIAVIRQLSGQATMFPLWTMGHWQCRERYKTSDELCEVLDRYRKLQIPLDGIV